MSQPLRIHPENPKIFEFRGRPLVLICATEHYGAVMNRPFRFDRYLRDAAEKSQTLTRLFTLFRELQSAYNPYSTCKPETPDYIAPFKRTGPGTALDEGLKYDLSQWNPEFLDRLHRFLSLASELGIIVEIVLLSNVYTDKVWELNPLHPKNNINGVEDITWVQSMSLRHKTLWKWQTAHVRKIVEETNRYDNIFYETCNEPGGGDAAEINQWLLAITDLIRDTEKSLPKKHLIAGTQATVWEPKVEIASDQAFREFPIDIVNMHPLPGMIHQGREYDLGQFMRKQLRLTAVRDYALASYREHKPLNYDEDNSSTQYKDVDAWTIHRKRAWTTLMSGAHYDMIDFSITIYTETGTPESQRYLRTWMKHLSEFIHSVDLVRARPLEVGWLREQPPHTVASVLAVRGDDYCIYLADGRELDEPGIGQSLHGHVACDLPDGPYRVACYAPVSGSYSPAVRIEGGRGRRIEVPPFQHDIVLRIRRESV